MAPSCWSPVHCTGCTGDSYGPYGMIGITALKTRPLNDYKLLKIMCEIEATLIVDQSLS